MSSIPGVCARRPQARTRVGRRLKELRAARKNLFSQLQGLSNAGDVGSGFEDAVQASVALQRNMAAESRVG